MICSAKHSPSSLAAAGLASLIHPRHSVIISTISSSNSPSSSLSSRKPLYLTPIERSGVGSPAVPLAPASMGRGDSAKIHSYEAERADVIHISEETRATAEQKLKIGFYFATWWALNVVFNIYNKKVLNAFPFPWLTSTLSLAVGSLIMLISWASRIAEAPKTDLEFWKALAPVAVTHTIGHVAATVSMSKVAVSFTHIIKSGEPAFSVLVSRFLLGEA